MSVPLIWDMFLNFLANPFIPPSLLVSQHFPCLVIELPIYFQPILDIPIILILSKSGEVHIG